MTDDEKAFTEHEIELEGQRCVCLKRKQMVSGKDPVCLTEQTQYSFDSGATWHLTQVDAYTLAKEAGTLMTVHDPGTDQAGDYEAFVLAFLHELGALEEGERLIVAKLAGQVMVMKEQTVLAVRASTIKDIDLRMEGGGG